MGVVEGDALRCCYYAWAYRGNGRIWQIPYLSPGAARPPRGVRAYPVREAYGLMFVFPGDPAKAAATPLPRLPAFDSTRHKTMTFSRTVACHYSFLHENLLDMNHQFLHRGVVGRIRPALLGYETGPHSVAARGTGSPMPAASPAAPPCSRRPPAGHRSTSIRTGYPYQTLQLAPPGPAGRRSPCGPPTCPRTPGSAPATPTACS